MIGEGLVGAPCDRDRHLGGQPRQEGVPRETFLDKLLEGDSFSNHQGMKAAQQNKPVVLHQTGMSRRVRRSSLLIG